MHTNDKNFRSRRRIRSHVVSSNKPNKGSKTNASIWNTKISVIILTLLIGGCTLHLKTQESITIKIQKHEKTYQRIQDSIKALKKKRAQDNEVHNR